ncbi:hypothetical protein ABB37_01493 [Leptomonas pyrrhocoris]|uniref:Uncharacterized protein n=1 Tax=Leptomonas pyrrhocoris TaxID=157538 RepID=A0A0N0DZA8_LEPPY|nr:hypothetical protein ABB37_01493 [Leptomonas pyrrhocoris]KPA85085.1 hypothetical protein ABB37_01493 [Leptomonas pyrrhocoris]|eukprot:XP_015663524.1 hypothetical protein ABB37_01493 [Leptomonas pyrrhocoris]
MQQPTTSSALDCCECGAVVGTEGPQRATLLLPCQHILHMGCVEFIKRRVKLLMGMDSADVVQDGGGDSAGAPLPNQNNDSNSKNWVQQMCGRCLCPACSAPVTHIIPLYLRSEDDPGATLPAKSGADGTPAASSPPLSAARAEEDYKRVHSAQKRVLLRLRGLCEQRRRMTELTHACASLHEQRARYLADVEKEERCFPGLLCGGGAQDDSAVTTTPGVSGGTRGGPSAPAGIPVEQMGITELELYMAQVTPRLLRTQAEVRKERQMVERRTKKLNALRTHYHSQKELHALDAEIAELQARVRGGVKRSTAHLHDDAPQLRGPQQPPSVSPSESPPLSQQEQYHSAREVILPSRTAGVPARKKYRGEEAIYVDDEPPAEVVEVLSQGSSDAGEQEVMVLDDDDAVAEVVGNGSDSEVNERSNDAAEEVNMYDAPYLIPCYIRASTLAGSSSVDPKTPRTTLTHGHVRMLPRREDRLWQPSLQF